MCAEMQISAGIKSRAKRDESRRRDGGKNQSNFARAHPLRTRAFTTTICMGTRLVTRETERERGREKDGGGNGRMIFSRKISRRVRKEFPRRCASTHTRTCVSSGVAELRVRRATSPRLVAIGRRCGFISDINTALVYRARPRARIAHYPSARDDCGRAERPSRENFARARTTRVTFNDR